MINAEKYKNELSEILSENRYIEVNKYDRKIRKCTGNNCPKCMFGITALGKGKDSCSLATMLWLLSEYKEHVKLTRLEYEILKLAINKSCEYIARDSDGQLYVFMEKPRKSESFWKTDGYYYLLEMFIVLFQFVQWSDLKPTSIKEVLNNCEVVEDDD